MVVGIFVNKFRTLRGTLAPSTMPTAPFFASRFGHQIFVIIVSTLTPFFLPLALTKSQKAKNGSPTPKSTRDVGKRSKVFVIIFVIIFVNAPPPTPRLWPKTGFSASLRRDVAPQPG